MSAASELITTLQKLVALHGDLPVVNEEDEEVAVEYSPGGSANDSVPAFLIAKS